MRWAYCIKTNQGGDTTKLQWYYVTADTEREAIRKVPASAYGGPLPAPPAGPQRLQ